MRRRAFLAQAGFASLAKALDRGRLETAEELLEDAVASGDAAWASLYVKQLGKRSRVACGPAPDPDLPFLLASITKPMTVTCLMILADAAELSLSDKVSRFIPEFRGGDRDKVTLRHLASHASGLPDMLPDNDAMRARHAPLKEFVDGACQTPLLFEPGTACRYQSMGILLIAEVVERITKTPLRDFMKKHLFAPLGMKSASLGLGGRRIQDLAPCEVTGNDSWNWNSPYWRDLGAPWGGAHANAEDVAKLLQYFMNPDWRVLRPETALWMVEDQNAGLDKAWGLGWAVQPSGFGKHCSKHTFGHSGSTGTLAWADPANSTVFVLLTSRPAAESSAKVIRPVSDLVSAAI